MDQHTTFPGIYRAKVLATDAAETDKLGRIKVEVYPMLVGKETARALKAVDSRSDIEGVDIAVLPWAVPAPPLFGGSGDGYGMFVVPKIGAFVWVFFEGADINEPVYFAEAPTKTLGLPTSRITNYPDRVVIKLSSGIEIILDDSLGNISIFGSGTLDITSTSNLSIVSSGNVNITGSGNVNITGALVNINP